ncbi:hypothetical protein BDV27DRAFT_3242 [Aspergillus caelatus]|uniref:Uncharacterized protein n=1 Tax=Aspergillus caelatus TaxID=61420 RepID=A0A5N7A214_9EURO|nr:uncharacterized protein BDV27DRAFT_3242 [Aspergillus caelatus]KAE8363862.1 hypothetical protein BDV27DRAFT_3242 [Aspergillus caelatus]
MVAFLSILRDRFLHWSTFQVAKCVTSIFSCLSCTFFVVGMCMARHTDGGDIRKRHAVQLRTATRRPWHGEKTGSTGSKGGIQPLYKDREKNFSLHRNHFIGCVSSGSDHHGQPCDLSDIPLETIEFNPYIPDLAAIL